MEARWAVLFDTLGIKWEYEREGYEVTDRLYLGASEDRWYYLPDFWLPEFGLHAEVKGSLLDYDKLLRFLSAAADLSSPNGGCGGGNDLVILGPIPLPDRRSRWPYVLHMHKGDLLAAPFWFMPNTRPCEYGDTRDVIATDCGDLCIDAYMCAEKLLAGHPDKVGDTVANAYRAARSARFEHGETGAHGR